MPRACADFVAPVEKPRVEPRSLSKEPYRGGAQDVATLRRHFICQRDEVVSGLSESRKEARRARRLVHIQRLAVRIARAAGDVAKLEVGVGRTLTTPSTTLKRGGGRRGSVRSTLNVAASPHLQVARRVGTGYQLELRLHHFILCPQNQCHLVSRASGSSLHWHSPPGYDVPHVLERKWLPVPSPS